jgi:spore photoproduct lyase
VPFEAWQQAYADTVRKIFEAVLPERITVGTLRFEDGFYKMRNTFLTTGDELRHYMNCMVPMFPPKQFPGSKRPKEGKYSFTEEKRIEIFDFIINEIQKYSNCRIALCKESASVWNKLGLSLSKCSCVCQLDYADMGN